MSTATRVLAALSAVLLTSGCIGNIRETTTARTSTEQLLVSTAAERAIAQFGNVDKELRGRRVAIDDTKFESVDKPYAVSAIRHYVSEHGGTLVPLAPSKDAAGKDVLPERVLEVRNGALGINDVSWGVGVPALPMPIPQTSMATVTPPLYLFYRGKQEGWAKFQFWIYDPRQEVYVAKSKDLWGHTYYSKWWFLMIGPFDFSNDIYPSDAEVNTGKPAKEVAVLERPGRHREGVRDFPTARMGY